MNQTRRNLFALAALAVMVAACHRSPQQDFNKGVAYFKDHNYAAASPYFQKALTTAPPTAQTWNFLGVCQLNDGQTDDAIHSFQEALKLDAAHSAARYNLALAALERGQTGEAIPHLHQLTQTANCPPDAYYYLGLAYFRASAWQQARPALEKAVQTSTAPDLFNYLGMVNTRLGDYKAAKLDFEQSLRSQPKFAPAYLNLATIEHRHLGNKTAALQHYRQYLDLLPKDQQREDIRLIIAQIDNEQSGRPKPAEAVHVTPVKPPEPPKPAPLTPATVAATSVTAPTPPAPPPVTTPPVTVALKPIASTPEPASAPAPPPPPPKKKRTALAPHQLKTGNTTKAAAYFNDAVKLHQQGQIAGAIALYGKAIATDPAYAQAYYNLAIAYRAAKQPDRAFDNYELALMANPTFNDARFNYALLLQEQAYNDDALSQYEKLLQSNPNDANLHLAAANLYARDATTVAQARAHYEAFLKLAPNSPVARNVRNWLAQTR